MVTFFGRAPRRIPTTALVVRKFSACPWHFFDGVPDSAPNEILWADVALTNVMGSGMNGFRTAAFLAAAEAPKARLLLSRIPSAQCLEDTPEDTSIWTDVDGLFEALRVPGVGTSRISKVLCRKRPGFVPMLDSVVRDYLNSIARQWSSRRRHPPKWFRNAWNDWRAVELTRFCGARAAVAQGAHDAEVTSTVRC
jgi:hypothetical protein